MFPSWLYQCFLCSLTLAWPEPGPVQPCAGRLSAIRIQYVLSYTSNLNPFHIRTRPYPRRGLTVHLNLNYVEPFSTQHLYIQHKFGLDIPEAFRSVIVIFNERKFDGSDNSGVNDNVCHFSGSFPLSRRNSCLVA